MELYLKLFEVLFPVFFVVGIGYYLGKKNPKIDTTFITNFVLYWYPDYYSEYKVPFIKTSFPPLDKSYGLFYNIFYNVWSEPRLQALFNFLQNVGLVLLALIPILLCILTRCSLQLVCITG